MSYTTFLAVGLALNVLAAVSKRGLAAAAVVLLAQGLHSAVSLGIYPALGVLGSLAWPLQLSAMLYGWGLLAPRLRGRAWNVLVEWPASAFLGGTFLAIPWALAPSLPPLGLLLPYGIGFVGLIQSLQGRREQVRLDLRAPLPVTRLTRNNPALSRRGPAPGEPAVRLVQITDTHLGGFMTVDRLAGICQRAVSAAPDLIVLTGDYLTFISNNEAAAFSEALAPLRSHPHVYACLGNHDLEAPEAVTQALASCGARLLVDEAAVVPTAAGPVEVLGLDHGAIVNLKAVLSAPRPQHGGRVIPRIALLHDPLRFKHCPPGTLDLALSGHTHGGQVGLVSLGLDLTAVGLLGLPDHGLWSWGTNHLYIHRGQGHYSPSLRIGVPAEESVLSIHFARSSS